MQTKNFCTVLGICEVSWFGLVWLTVGNSTIFSSGGIRNKSNNTWRKAKKCNGNRFSVRKNNQDKIRSDPVSLNVVQVSSMVVWLKRRDYDQHGLGGRLVKAP